MRKLQTLAIVAAAFLITACVPSLHPLYTDDDLIFESALVGRWAQDDDEDQTVWSFEKSGDRAYDLTLSERGTKGAFDVRLLRLGDDLFLDIFPKERDDDNGFYDLNLIPAHTFAKVDLQTDRLAISMMNEGAIRRMLDKEKLELKHERVPKKGIVLTAPTEELQQFVREHANDPKLFDHSQELHRAQ